MKSESLRKSEMTDLKNIRACIFDLDESLVDSMWMWHAIDEEYLGKFHLECPDDLQEKIEGMSFTETAHYFKSRFSLPDPIEKIKRDWEEMSVDKYRYEVSLKPGAMEFLKECRKRGIRMGIATSNGRLMVDEVLKATGTDGFFSSVVTACEVNAGKPNPDIYLKVASELGVGPEFCLVFEDIPAGIKAGISAGMQVCAVEDDFSAAIKEEKIRLAGSMIADYRELIFPV
jgi:HAD superfamily hydrolase (TIGR01509 family)